MKGVVRLILVRHGEAVANTDMRYLGSRDDALTERGVWQAAQLAQPVPLDPQLVVRPEEQPRYVHLSLSLRLG